MCEVGSEFLLLISTNVMLQSSVTARAVSLRPLSTASRLRSRVSPCGICGDKVVLGQVPLSVRWFSPVSTVTPMLHTHLHLNTILIGRTSGRSLGTFQQSNALYIKILFLCGNTSKG